MPASNYIIEDFYNPMVDNNELHERQERLNGCLCDTEDRCPTLSEVVADCPLHGYEL